MKNLDVRSDRRYEVTALRRQLATITILLALASQALAQTTGYQGMVMFSANCANTPQMGRSEVCYDTGIKNWFAWNPTATPPAFQAVGGGLGLIITGTGLTGNGSAGTPAALTVPVAVANGGTSCTAPVNFSGLPGTPTQGAICSVLDATACTTGTAVTVGGGTTYCQVVWDGTQWIPAGGAVANNPGGVTSVNGSGNIASSGGSTPTISFTGTLPSTNGGTASDLHTAGSGTYPKSNGANPAVFSASTLPAAGTGNCTNQAVTALNGDAVPTCTTITSAYVNTSIAKTGTDINTSNQVTATHLASALPVAQGGTGTGSTLTGIARGGSPMTASELSGDATTSGSNAVSVVKVNGNTPGGTCTNQAVTSLDSSARPTCTTITSSYTDTSIAQTGVDINTSNQVTATHLAAALPIAQGGTAGTTAATARTALSAAQSGSNSDITSLSGLSTPLSVAQGGNGTTYGPAAVWAQKANAASTGTTINKLFTTNSSGNAVNVSAGATSGALGLCDSGCGTTGTGTFLVGPADHSCVFDGGVTRNDYVGISASVAGDCTDAGATPPVGVETIGRVDQATTAGTGTYTVFFYGPDFSGNGGGGVNAGTANQIAYYAATGSTVSSIASGAAAYSNISGGFAANANLTGTDTVSLSTGNQKLTLTANETLTIQKGTITNTPSATNIYTNQFEICQNATGNFTLAFAAGTGVSNIYWNGGAQPGYTVTPSNGDWYTCQYDGTNLRCRETMSNAPC